MPGLVADTSLPGLSVLGPGAGLPARRVSQRVGHSVRRQLLFAFVFAVANGLSRTSCALPSAPKPPLIGLVQGKGKTRACAERVEG